MSTFIFYIVVIPAAAVGGAIIGHFIGRALGRWVLGGRK